MSHHKFRKEKNCLNCGAEVTGKFCSECGMANIETRENFFHLVGHFISDYLHFDSKFFKSLSYLFTRPGFLTRQYWDGKRVKYIQPLRLFFFITIIFVLATSLFYGRYGDVVKERMITGDSAIAKIDTTEFTHLNDSVKRYFPALSDTLTIGEVREAKTKYPRMIKKMQAGVDHLFAYLKYIMFFLLPVYALWFKMLYIRRKTFYVDQLVYVMHLQSFVFCLLLVVLLVVFAIPGLIRFVQGVILLAVFIYIGLSLHYLHRQQWWKTLLKSLVATFLLFFTTIVVMILFAGLDAMYIQK